MYSLKPLTPPSVSITTATSSSDVLLRDPTSQQSAASAAGGGGGVLMQAAPPVVITSPADVVSVELDKDVMRRNLSMVDTADGVTVDTASGSDHQQHSLQSSVSRTFSQSVVLRAFRLRFLVWRDGPGKASNPTCAPVISQLCTMRFLGIGVGRNSNWG